MALLMMLTVAYFAHKNNWGGDIKFDRPSRSARRCSKLAWWSRLAARDLAGWCELGVPAAAAPSSSASSCCSRPTGISSSQAVLPIMTPVLLIGGMTTGHLHADRRRDRRLRLGAVPRPRLVPHARPGRCSSRSAMDTVETTATVLFIVAAASIFGWMLTATRRHRRRSPSGCSAFTQRAVGVPAARQPADAVRRLLPRADRGDHDPGADPAADLPASSASTRCTSAW